MFQLAIDRPSISHGTSSQRTSGADMIWSINSSVLMPLVLPAVHEEGPSHQPRSTLTNKPWARRSTNASTAMSRAAQ